MNKPKATTIFFGSFLHYSTMVLKALHQSDLVEIVGVVTTPPRPAGRKQELKKTHTHLYAEKHHLPILTPDNLNQPSLRKLNSLFVIRNSQENRPDFLVTAGYGQILPNSWLQYPTIAALNLHFSLLPRYRGAMPAEWALLYGEKETGVTLIEMNQQLDAGRIISQTSIPINQTCTDTSIYRCKAKKQSRSIKNTPDTRETLYQKLYPLAAQLFLDTLPHYLNWKNKNKLEQLGQLEIRNSRLFLPPKKQSGPHSPYARLLNKQDAFIPWPLLLKATQGKHIKPSSLPPLLQTAHKHSNPDIQHSTFNILERSIRALVPWPSAWTLVPTSKGKKRMKLLSAHLSQLPTTNYLLHLDTVHLEGLPHPTPFNQIKNTMT